MANLMRLIPTPDTPTYPVVSDDKLNEVNDTSDTFTFPTERQWHI
jgi:hypothetical protein